MPAALTSVDESDSSNSPIDLFLERVRQDLAVNSMLRGSWVEQIVASYLGVNEFPGGFNYFDLRTHDGYSISIKHSVGVRATFDVSGRDNAWDNELAAQLRRDNPKAEGWLVNDSDGPRRWCDIWVLAHLAGEPTLDRVIDPSEWGFAVVTSDWLDGLPNKSITLGGLSARGVEFIAGDLLGEAVGLATQQLGCPRCWHDAEILESAE